MSATSRPVNTRTLALPDMVQELTRMHTHRELYVHDAGGRRQPAVSRYHQVLVPALLDQLGDFMPGSDTSSGSVRGFESRPTANLESLDVLVNLDHATDDWLLRLGLPTSGAVRVRIRRLHSRLYHLQPCKRAHPRSGCCQRHDLEAAIRQWYVRARVVTGWDSPAWRPASTCPVCEESNTLRIKLLEEYALCVHCYATWDSATIGLLADHIRAEAERRSNPDAPKEDAGA